jgi:putative ABC transport system permease protein
VACINFVTLSIGRSIKRAKEVGVRKVAGAQRRELVVQFIGEAIIITCVALILGVLLAWSSMPVFNDLAGKQLVFSFDGFMIGVLTGLIGIIGLIAGSYPAFILSSFRPVTVLKGAMQTGYNKQRLRKVLVGVQLTLSVFLISSTLLMKEQLQYLQSRNLGFDREQLAVMQLNVRGGRLSERVVAGLEKAMQFKSELTRIPQVAAVTVSSHDFGHGDWLNIGYTDDEGTYRTFFYNTIDADFLPVMKMELASGRNFSDDNPSDRKRSIIVNEAFVKEYGWKDALGKRIPGKKFEDHEIIGVVKDFNFSSLYTKVEPVVMALDPKVVFSGIENIGVNNTPIPKLFVKLKPGNASATLEEIKNVWNKLTGGEEFIFSFVDDAIDSQYRNDRNLGKIVSIATLIAMIIGSLGLYGLASLAMQNRTKEISIRKVLGATENSLLLLLSREYIYLVLASLVVSIPVTIYLMTGWLSTFEYHVSIGPGLFLIAGGISLAIALLTISYQAIRTAWSQPAQTLKYE